MVDERVLLLWLKVLLWSGLSFARVRRPWGAEDSWPHLGASVAAAGAFLWLFLRIDPASYRDAAEAYKTSAAVYPIYIKFTCLMVVAFLVCGNLRNRKVAELARVASGVPEGLEDVGGRGRGDGGRGPILGFFAFAGATTGLNLWADAHLDIHYERAFTVVQYVCSYYLALFTAHFAITMSFVAGNYKRLNAAFRKIVNEKEPSGEEWKRKLRTWASASMELRGVEDLINKIFGEQIFFGLTLAVSSIIMNGYYFVTLNLYETSNFWLNLQMLTGFGQSLTVALLIATAAESVTNEANKTREFTFTFPIHHRNRKIFSQVKYLALFAHNHPMELKACIFYAVDRGTLFKMMLTASAITTVILQCDFLRGSLESSQ